MQTLPHLETSVRGFVFGLADASGTIDADSLYLAAEAAGFTTTKVRLGLRRLVDAGLLDIDGRGRDASIHLTAAGLDERAPDMAWIGAAYRNDAGLDRWDDRWHLATFEVPESQRTSRDALRTRITELFGGALGGGIYVSPFAWEAWLVATADQHGIRDRLTLIEADHLQRGGASEPAEVAASIWPIADIDTGYRHFVEQWSDRATDVPTDPYEAIHLAFAAAGQFEATFRTDPLLPVELVPTDFAGPAARRLFIDLIAAVSTHDLVARANLFATYRQVVDAAITADADSFWTAVYEQTV